MEEVKEGVMKLGTVWGNPFSDSPCCITFSSYIFGSTEIWCLFVSFFLLWVLVCRKGTGKKMAKANKYLN